MPKVKPTNELRPDDVLLTIREACRVLRCSRATFFKLSKEGKIEMVKYGYRTSRVLKRSVDKFLLETGPAGYRRGAA